MINIKYFTLKYSFGMYDLYYKEDNKYLTDGYARDKEISINENYIILDGRIFTIIKEED